jgi:chemotaxis protein methyltransferase CheR
MSLSLSGALSLRKTPPISDEEFRKLRDFIYGKCGIFVDDKRKYLFETRLGPRLSALGAKSFSEYYQVLTLSPDKDRELANLFELVTTNETSLYRDTRQLDGVRTSIIGRILKEQRAKGRFELNIWSAGCSSGEEPYTLSILLHEELGPELRKWRIQITGVDLSPAMVAKAKAGVYQDYAFKTTPEAIRKKYFYPVDGGLKVMESVASLASFQQMNLNDPVALKRIPKSHVVFCRNVIIYFDDAMKQKVVSAFYDNLLPGGVLVLGHSETLHKISSAFKPMLLPGAMAYEKI